MPGGRRPIDEDTVNIFAVIGGIFLVIFFLMVIRVYLDSRAGKPVAPLKPTRSPFRIPPARPERPQKTLPAADEK